MVHHMLKIVIKIIMVEEATQHDFLIRSNGDAGVKSRDEMDSVQVAVLMLYSEGKKRKGKESG